jgi:hypothetical protein
MTNKRRIKSNKNKSEQLIVFVSILLCLVIILCISGCSIFNPVKKTFSGEEEESLEVPEVKIDEGEIKEISGSEENIRKSYVMENEISLIDDSARNPFKPFYIKEEEEEENILTLKGISSKDGVEYAELDFNGYTYNLRETETISDIYLVQAINVDSVALLKGDEIVNLYIGIPVYD